MSQQVSICLFSDVILCLPLSSQINVSAVPKAAETLLTRQMGKENTTAFFIVTNLYRTLRSRDDDIQILVMNMTFSQLHYLL